MILNGIDISIKNKNNFLKIEDRLYTFPWIKFDSFDQVLNNFIASYFAGALIIPRTSINEKLSDFFALEEWNQLKLLEIIFYIFGIYSFSHQT